MLLVLKLLVIKLLLVNKQKYNKLITKHQLLVLNQIFNLHNN